MKGAVKGMMEYLSINFANKSTVHSENDEFYGMGRIFHPFKFEEWIARHEQYQEYEKNLKRKKIVIGVRAAMGGPGIGAQGGLLIWEVPQSIARYLKSSRSKGGWVRLKSQF